MLLKHKLFKTSLSFVLTLAMLFVMAMPVFAETPCSLTITYQYSGSPVTDMEVSIYKVASISGTTYTVLSPFNTCGSEFKLDTTTDQKNTAYAFENYVTTNNIVPTAISDTNASGKVSFTGLSKGYYLARISSRTHANMVINAGPFICSLPEDNNGVFTYNVMASSKTDITLGDISKQVTKVWDDSQNADGLRPTSVTVSLYKDGAVSESVTLDSSNNWAHTWTGLSPRYTWSVREASVPTGYADTYSATANGVTITNKHTVTPPGGGGGGTRPGKPTPTPPAVTTPEPITPTPDVTPEPDVPDVTPEPEITPEPELTPPVATEKPKVENPYIATKLPQTGLEAWQIYTLLGIAMAIMAVAVICSNRKKKVAGEDNRVSPVIMIYATSLSCICVALAVGLVINDITTDAGSGTNCATIMSVFNGEDVDANAVREVVEDETYLTIDGVSYIGYLSVPSVNLDVPVQADYTSVRVLKKSPCRYAGTIAGDDIVIAGHNYRSQFTKLQNVAVGAEVVFTDASDIEHRYAVSEVEILGSRDVDEMLLDAEDEWDMTLFTCCNGGKDRKAVRCTHVD